MKRLFILLFVFIGACGIHKESTRVISMAEIERVGPDVSDESIRAIEILNDSIMGFGSNKSVVIYKSGETYEGADGRSVYLEVEKGEKERQLSFRATAFTKSHFFALSIANPANLYRCDFSMNCDLVYEEEHEKVFYDSIEFWNEREGIAMGDPTNGCLSIIITGDGGRTWDKVSCDKLPKAAEGEAAFAASDTNIAIVGNKAWIISGGTKSRVYFTPDKGKNWEVYNTPLIQGEGAQGGYSIDFFDKHNGFIIGGDYTKPDVNTANKAITKDGGKTWELVAIGSDPDYRSCVQYIPNGVGNELVAVGFRGMSYSSDYGYTWKKISDESFYTIRFLNDSVAYAAGKGKISKIYFK